MGMWSVTKSQTVTVRFSIPCPKDTWCGVVPRGYEWTVAPISWSSMSRWERPTHKKHRTRMCVRCWLQLPGTVTHTLPIEATILFHKSHPVLSHDPFLCPPVCFLVCVRVYLCVCLLLNQLHPYCESARTPWRQVGMCL